MEWLLEILHLAIWNFLKHQKENRFLSWQDLPAFRHALYHQEALRTRATQDNSSRWWSSEAPVIPTKTANKPRRNRKKSE